MTDDQDYSHLYHKDNKEEKKHRKTLQQKDRSRYKKSNLSKVEKEVPCLKNCLKGQVLTLIPSGALCYEPEEKIVYSLSISGSLKHTITQDKNIIAVGDRVYFKKEGKEEGSIVYIEERSSQLLRQSTVKKNKHHILAANVDQVIIVISVMNPLLKPALIDRYLIAAKEGNLKPIILINKVDLLELISLDDEESIKERMLFEDVVKTYTQLGYTVITCSSKTKEGYKDLLDLMKDKISVFSGHSGVGKTTLINELTGESFATASVHESRKKGAHTTTQPRLIPISEEGGFCVDTPGIRTFGITDMDAHVLKSHFFEIDALSAECRFMNCSHIHEPFCAVKKGVEEGSVSKLRYLSYCNLLRGLDEEDSFS